MIHFRERCLQEEAMDDPGLGAGQLDAVFRDLNHTNLLLGGQRITMNALKDLMNRYPREEYRVTDMGCGDGDLLRRIARYCRENSIAVSCLGIDNSVAALELAVAKSAGFPEIMYKKASILDPDDEHPCDILLCTLTLHHFKDREITGILNRFSRMASLGVIINDLERNRLAYYLFHAFSLIFIKTKIAKQDGLISIRRGFLREELQGMSLAFPNLEHRIRWRWAFRYLWVMQAKAVALHE